ncbi:hypothetical protein Nepgr_023129 [Nepenthes gracilis]|uniref:Secreted protein n=1 Tax=Nepenthes gracilis TaxID=150966 RepID=A0AAD3T3A6_NEPGR|nr:hypothetical protein Nepgr_023129 [Nepenthes gracilis]
MCRCSGLPLMMLQLGPCCCCLAIRCSRQCHLAGMQLPSWVESRLQLDCAAIAACFVSFLPSCAGMLSGKMSFALLTGNGPVVLLSC